MITDEEWNAILGNRRTWAEFLMKPGRRKAVGTLDRGNGKRCCLGHAAYILGAKKSIDEDKTIWYDDSYEMAPYSIVDKLGLWDDTGGNTNANIYPISDKEYTNVYYGTLADVNDETSVSPQRIGKYLLTVIEGGVDTPFRPRSDY